MDHLPPTPSAHDGTRYSEVFFLLSPEKMLPTLSFDPKWLNIRNERVVIPFLED